MVRRSRRKRWCGAAFSFGCVLLILAFTSEAQAQATVTDLNDWMLEVVSPNYTPFYLEISPGLDGTAGFALQPADAISDEQDHAGRAMLELKYRPEAGTVSLQVSLDLGPANTEPSQRLPDVPIGNYLVRPNDSILISQLSQYGLKPVEVRLVRAKPPESTLLPVINNTSSLIVEHVDEDRAYYRIALRNVSPLAVEGVVASVVGTSGVIDMFRQFSAFSSPLLASGESREIRISNEDNPSGAEQIQIDAVVFADGSSEGDQTNAAILEATYVARKQQEQRIASLVEKQLEDTDLDDNAKIKILHSQVAALTVEPEPSLINSVLARSMNLTDQQKQLILKNMRDGLELAKGIFLGQLKLYGIEKSNRQGFPVSLKEWWETTEGQCGGVFAPSCTEIEAIHNPHRR
jgi:hypothetical protein